ncbi:MAG: CotH kinase family protein [Deltaproteobacteria bacterium]|nr:CotH kinase family protein [Deltaproteobacteria bacterium]
MLTDPSRTNACWLLALALGLLGCDDVPPPSFGEDARRPPADVALAETRDTATRQDLTPAETTSEDAETTPDVATDGATGPELDASTPPSGLVLNEIDCRGLPLDWVEILNLGASAIDVSGMVVTDSLSDETHFVPLGDVPLGPGERRVVALDRFGVKCGDDGVAVLDGGKLVATAGPTANPPSSTWGRVPDGTGDFTVSVPTPGAANERSSLDPNDPMGSLYDPAAPPVEIALGLDALAYAALVAEPREWVPATFALTDAHGTTEMDVALKLKGAYSFKPLGEKAAFRLDFNRLIDTTFRGLESMTLNNSGQDPSHINEALAYAFFRRAGVPAPRVGFAWVTVNGDDYGLYNNIESPDDRWMDDHFATSLALFEGDYGVDVTPEDARLIPIKEGPEFASYEALQRVAVALQDALERVPPSEVMATTSAFVDWAEVVAFMASEIVIGHWDGYLTNRNNYFLHIDGSGRIRLAPWGVDQTFGRPMDPYSQDGVIHKVCMRDPACRGALEDAILGQLATIRNGSAWAALAPLPALLQPYVDEEPGADGDSVAEGLDEAKSYLVRRNAELAEAIACVRDPAEDVDADGHACDTDCDEGDPDTHLSAVELCGDGLDQDCSGVADDRGCPECQEIVRDARVYRFCWRPRTYVQARALCVDGGGVPVVVNDKPENDWLGDEVHRLGYERIWLGLTDRIVEGEYRWEDGRDVLSGFVDYEDGEPNDYEGAEDCTELRAYGGGSEVWNDEPCEVPRPVVCEQVGSP